MSTWSSRLNLIRDPLETEIYKNYSNKPSFKIDPIGKLQIIHALDNGQCKLDIAKEYGVHPQTIAYIYKQKDSTIKKYTEKYNLNNSRGMSLDQSLLDWFNFETKQGRVVHLVDLQLKAQEIIHNLNEKFSCLDDWLSDFLLRHNIIKYNTEIESTTVAKEDWTSFVTDFEARNIYFSSFTALSYRLDIHSYIKGHNINNFMSLMLIMNITGLDKCPLALVGNEPFDADSNVKSLPLDYYYSDNPQINPSIIENYLKRWDADLGLKERHICLILDIPDNIIGRFSLKNIQIINNKYKDYVSKISEKLISCFKHHYRRLHITQSVLPQDCLPSLLDYFHMMSMAWHNVSHKYIHRLCFPTNDGALYFKIDEGNDYANNTLAEWVKITELPLDVELCSDTLGKYVLCDDMLPSYNWGIINRITPYINEMLLQRNPSPISAMEAYQAMNRLVSYLQGEHASSHTIQCAKYLEDHIEYSALLQINEIATNNTNEELAAQNNETL